MALRREVVDLTDALVFVLEGQLAQHFRGSRHQELNGTYGLTWRWRGPVRGAATVLHGLSWATSDPRFPADSSPPREPVRLLSFLGAEIALELPARPDTALVLRYHHRSGAFGLLEGGHDEYTMVGAGFQVRF